MPERKAPKPRRQPVPRTLFGETIVDPYAWMQERESEEVLAHLRAENDYTESCLSDQAALRQAIFNEMKSRTQETDLSVPARKGDYWYLARTEEGKQYPVSCRRRGAADGPEEILLDGNVLAGDSEYFALGALEISPDDAVVAYSTDHNGAEQYELHFRDLASGLDLEDVIPETYYGSAWALDSTTYYYTRPDDAMRPHQLWRHQLGTPSDHDVLVFQEEDERFFLEVESSRSEALIFITLQSQTTSEVWILDAADVAAPPRCTRPREDGVEYWIEHEPGEDGGTLLILTTLGAPDGRVVVAPVSEPSAWREIVPETSGLKIDGVDAFASHRVIWCRRDGMSGVMLMPRDGSATSDLALDEEVRTVDTGTNLEYETDTLRFDYESLVTPSSVYELDLRDGSRTLLKQQPVLGHYETGDWESRREWAVAADGARIPISIVLPRDTPQTGSAPLVLYAYGAYESNTDPWFSISRLSLLERGVVFAIAHVRGGGELGRHWYDQGKLANKQNTFTDFVTCAEHLIAEGYTHPTRLAARGGSAGGLLVAAAMNLRPGLFRAVVAEVPFVDVVNTMLDSTLPLTVTEWEEWGNPATETQYHWLREYAPYENVQPTRYPRVLATAGLNDPRVQYWEPAKWVAMLREVTTGDEPILLRTEMGAGHGGPSGRYDAWRDEALVLAFLLDALDAAEVAPQADAERS